MSAGVAMVGTTALATVRKSPLTSIDSRIGCECCGKVVDDGVCDEEVIDESTLGEATSIATLPTDSVGGVVGPESRFFCMNRMLRVVPDSVLGDGSRSFCCVPSWTAPVDGDNDPTLACAPRAVGFDVPGIHMVVTGSTDSVNRK